MGLLSVDLLITLQILPVFFSNCLFLALYDSVILLKHMVLVFEFTKEKKGQTGRRSPKLQRNPHSQGQ
ncbi:Type II iodothyronine deiodinase [Tyto alba]|uniref:Type II iodothyronine deiodinase n=1 Tax=Tyto alba TaxID=56313 RepID=A0A093F0Z1_TYTAL|nr:Type II iodothyronine deiodinase [Tyto alba]